MKTEEGVQQIIYMDPNNDCEEDIGDQGRYTCYKSVVWGWTFRICQCLVFVRTTHFVFGVHTGISVVSPPLDGSAARI